MTVQQLIDILNISKGYDIVGYIQKDFNSQVGIIPETLKNP